MNDVYFACHRCKTYVDAGYRWAAVMLEEAGVVHQGSVVDVLSVFRCSEFWEAPLGEESSTPDWLSDLMPAIRRFLTLHADHHVVYGDREHVAVPTYSSDPPELYFLWLKEAGWVLEESPRWWRERLHLSLWSEVELHVAGLEFPPRWWSEPAYRSVAQRVFEAGGYGAAC